MAQEQVSEQVLLPSKALLQYMQQDAGAVVGIVIVMFIYMAGWALSGYALSHVLQTFGKWKWLLVLISAYAMILLGDVGVDLLESYINPRLTDFVGSNIMRHVLKEYESRRTSPDTGKLISLYSNLHINTTELFVKMRDYCLPFVVAIIVSVVYLFKLHKYLGAIMLGCSVIYFGLFAGLCHVQVLQGDELENCRLNHENRVTDMIMNMHNIYAANMTDRQLGVFHDDLRECSELQVKLLQLHAGLRVVLNIAIIGILLGLVICASWLFKKNMLNAQQLTAFSFVLSFIWSGLDAPARHVNSIAWYISYLREADKTAVTLTDVDDQATGTDATPPRSGLIVFKTVRVNALLLPNLTLREGERLAIQGPIGSGKSTILNVLFGKLRYTGTATMGGREVADADVVAWRNHIVLVPQTVILFDETVYYNISYGNDATREQVQAAMDKYNMTFATLDTPVGRLGERLSGGQRQMIFLLRSYFRKNIKLVLMDEPTSALDAKTKQYAYKLILDVIGKRTSIIVTHDPSLSSICTQTVTMGTYA
jgi:ABC-type multidrug transport system fused ATPase/permease subunit